MKLGGALFGNKEEDTPVMNSVLYEGLPSYAKDANKGLIKSERVLLVSNADRFAKEITSLNGFLNREIVRGLAEEPYMPNMLFTTNLYLRLENNNPLVIARGTTIQCSEKGMNIIIHQFRNFYGVDNGVWTISDKEFFERRLRQRRYILDCIGLNEDELLEQYHIMLPFLVYTGSGEINGNSKDYVVVKKKPDMKDLSIKVTGTFYKLPEDNQNWRMPLSLGYKGCLLSISDDTLETFMKLTAKGIVPPYEALWGDIKGVVISALQEPSEGIEKAFLSKKTDEVATDFGERIISFITDEAEAEKLICSRRVLAGTLPNGETLTFLNNVNLYVVPAILCVKVNHQGLTPSDLKSLCIYTQ